MLVSLIPTLGLQERAKLQSWSQLRWANTSEGASGAFQMYKAFVLKVCALRECWTRGVKVRIAGRILNNHHDALFNTL